MFLVPPPITIIFPVTPEDPILSTVGLDPDYLHRVQEFDQNTVQKIRALQHTAPSKERRFCSGNGDVSL